MELPSATTVTRPPEEGYAFRRQLDRLPTSMAHLDEVLTGGRGPDEYDRAEQAVRSETAQCHVQRYMHPLLERIERGGIGPTRVITHRLPPAEAPHGSDVRNDIRNDIFEHKQDAGEKVGLKP